MLKEFQNDTVIVNVKNSDYDIYIGRGFDSIWGNPYTHISDKKTAAKFIVKSREDAISKYRDWILNQPELMNRLEELRGKRLGCWCAPKKCHGEILIELLQMNMFDK